MDKIEIPTRQEAAEIVASASHQLEWLLGTEPTGGEIDWVGVFERAQSSLNLSGSGQRGGTIVLRDWYPLDRTLVLDSHVELVGDFRAKHHLGSSAGFRAEQGFTGDYVLEWKKPQSDTLYSNFGAGCRMLHVQTWPGKGGVSFRGAQQSAGIENLVVRGFGEYGTGLVLGGDTYSVRDVFLDATIGGEASAARVWSTGLATKERVQGLLVENLTTHNCATGLELSNAVEVKVQSFETELTTIPIRLTYNAMGLTFANCQIRHTGNIMHIERARWPSDFLVKVGGMMVGDERSGSVQLPGGGAAWKTPGKVFELAIQGDSGGISVIDVKAMRETT
jgi:hypothetical protein